MTTVIFACVHKAGRSQMAAAFLGALADPAVIREILARIGLPTSCPTTTARTSRFLATGPTDAKAVGKTTSAAALHSTITSPSTSSSSPR